MPYLGPLSAIHLALLVGLGVATARALFVAALPRLLAAAVLVWANLVLTAIVLSPFGRLGSPPAYFAVSIGLAVAARWGLRRVCPAPTVGGGPSWAELARAVRADRVSRTLAGGLTAVAAAAGVVAVAVLPNNWDSLAYRFPRAYFFLSSGALVHAAPAIDTRLNEYPYNGTLLYLFLAQYAWPPIAWNFVGVAGWLLCGAAAMQLALHVGASVRGALASGAFLLTTPIVLCLANSTNDELLAAAPLATALALLLLGYRHGSPPALYLALVAGGLGAGVKLHWPWLVPWLAIGFAAAARREGGAIGRRVRATIRPAAFAAAAVVAVALAASFLVGNYLASGRLRVIDPAFAAGIVNRPFHAGAALQTAGLYTAQMLLSPVVDHARILGVERGRAAYEGANALTMEWLGDRVRQGPPYTHDGYRFRGLVEPNAHVFFEQSLWLGWLPHLTLAALGVLLWRRPSGWELPAFLLAALPLWHLTHAAMVRYAETTGTYYAFVAPFAAAPLGWLWERARRSPRRAGRAFAVVAVVALASHAALAATLLLSNQRRNVVHAVSPASRGGWATATNRVSPLLPALLAEARRVEIPYTHWELLYWSLMRLHPGASYVTGEEDGAADLELYALARRLDDNYALRLLPVRYEGPGAVRLAGTMNAGDDVVFCAGPTCESVCARCETYLLLPLRIEPGAAGVERAIGGPPPRSGLRWPAGAYELRLDLRGAGGRRGGWTALDGLSDRPLALPEPLPSRLTIELRARADETAAPWRTILRRRAGALVFESP